MLDRSDRHPTGSHGAQRVIIRNLLKKFQFCYFGRLWRVAIWGLSDEQTRHPSGGQLGHPSGGQLGCPSSGQAHRVAHWAARRVQNGKIGNLLEIFNVGVAIFQIAFLKIKIHSI